MRGKLTERSTHLARWWTLQWQQIRNVVMEEVKSVSPYGWFSLNDFSPILHHIVCHRQNCRVIHDFEKSEMRRGLVICHARDLFFFHLQRSKTPKRKVLHSRILGELQWRINCWHGGNPAGAHEQCFLKETGQKLFDFNFKLLWFSCNQVKKWPKIGEKSVSALLS